jgi:CO/xanthine dehydrogenase FAD-binding subunit
VSIGKYLGGVGDIVEKETQVDDALLKSDNPGGEKKQKLVPPELSVEERIKGFDLEVVKGVEIGAVEAEAKRCLNCGCMAVSPSDIAPALIALNAQIKTTKRKIAADEFFALAGNKTTVLDEDEIVTGIELPAAGKDRGQAFIKFAQRPTIDFAVVNAAAVIGTAADGKVEEARVVLGAVAPVPYRVSGAEAMLKGKVLDEELAEKAAETITAEAVMMKDNPYKLQIAKTLVKRAILAAKPGN